MRQPQNCTWHPAHSLGPNLGEEQGLDPSPVGPVLYPGAPSVFSSVEYVFCIVEGDDEGGFCVGRQGGNDASGPSGDSHPGLGDVGAFLKVSVAQDTWVVFTGVECP